MIPASSSKMRKVTILRESQSRSASASMGLMPQSTSSPGPIEATFRTSTVTLASSTRCTTARIRVPGSAHDFALDAVHLTADEGNGGDGSGGGGGGDGGRLVASLS